MSLWITAQAAAKSVSLQDYEQWFNTQWLFDKLADMTMGQSFCTQFGITDYYLSKFKQSDIAKEWITNNYLR